jgi:hypothetical protein
VIDRLVLRIAEHGLLEVVLVLLSGTAFPAPR